MAALFAIRAARALPTSFPSRRRRRTCPTAQPCELCHSPSKFNNFGGGTMNHAGISSGCANCHGTGKSFYRRDDRHAAGHAHSGRYRGLRGLPRAGEIHELRRHGDEPRAGRRNGLRHLPRGRQELFRRRPSSRGPRWRRTRITRRPANAAIATPPRCRSRPASPRAGQPHPDHAALRAVSHDAGQLCRCDDEPLGHHERMRDLPLDRLELRQRHTRLAATDARADIASLRALPCADQVHQFQRRHDEPRRHHVRLRELPRQRQELLRSHHRDAARPLTFPSVRPPARLVTRRPSSRTSPVPR